MGVSRYQNLALFLLLAALWGSSFMAITAGLAYFPPVLFAALRYDVAGVLSADGLGTALVFAAALSVALGSVVTAWLDHGLEVETMEAWSMVGGAALLHVVSGGLGESAGAVTWSAPALWALAYLALGTSAVGFLIYFDLLDRLGPVEVNLVFSEQQMDLLSTRTRIGHRVRCWFRSETISPGRSVSETVAWVVSGWIYKPPRARDKLTGDIV